jgi:hypothetical protein
MQIQTGIATVTTGLARPEQGRANPRGGGARAGAPFEATTGLPVPQRGSVLPEVRLAVAANFAEEARPARTLPRGSLVDLVI